jgi:hypothetical protein
MLRIAIVGCGKIADQHVSAIKFMPGLIAWLTGFDRLKLEEDKS